MPTFWDRVRGLNAQTIETLVEGKPFRVVDVTHERITLVPLAGKGDSRWVGKAQLEHLNEIFYDEETVTPTMVRAKLPKNQNTAYIAAIINAVKED